MIIPWYRRRFPEQPWSRRSWSNDRGETTAAKGSLAEIGLHSTIFVSTWSYIKHLSQLLYNVSTLVVYVHSSPHPSSPSASTNRISTNWFRAGMATTVSLCSLCPLSPSRARSRSLFAPSLPFSLSFFLYIYSVWWCEVFHDVTWCDVYDGDTIVVSKRHNNTSSRLQRRLTETQIMNRRLVGIKPLTCQRAIKL